MTTRRRLAWALAGALSAAAVPAAAIDWSRNYGTFCQQDFQDNWRPFLGDTWTQCANFNAAMDLLAPRRFYFNLHGAAHRFEDAGDQDGAGLDTVDVVYVSTHSGAWTGPARGTFTMWDNGLRAFSTNMRLGDEDRGLSLLAAHTCELLKDDGQIIDRWATTFDGGLRMIVGSHDSLFAGSGSVNEGRRFADNLRAGQTIKNAWLNALSGTSNDNDVAVAATGASEADCWNRMDSLTWANLTTTPRLRDWDWQWMCWNWWDNR